ncbi:MAG TPA: formate dehydrogenase accessory sulfurtransferase FdhD [Desulfobacteraceae bacterium]|nr:formate dehydrogenase accessory sulfurtransferase FdhD [Deltaproteobacteria bacterium]HDI60559.1 formate dehydrogenase accessory sulfurtransferase FdhD [Desulfobacteraceae bacterium]
MDAIHSVNVSGVEAEQTRELIGEVPVRISIQGRPEATLLATPGEADALAAGFCLSEGLIGDPEDLAAVRVDAEGAQVALTARRLAAVASRLADQVFFNAADFDLHDVAPLPAGPVFDPAAVRGKIEALDTLQPLRRRTRAAHAAALYDADLNLLSVAEDVGRHNALDKAVGKLLLGGGFHRIRLLVLSSRISFEMVNKAARARVAVVAAVSRPTALAVSLARRVNMTLATPAGPAGLCVYCGQQRLAGFD